MTDDERGTILQTLKTTPGVRLPIRDDGMNVVGWLRAFDKSMLSDMELIRIMAKARTLNKDFFMTQFDVTADNKREWLENSVLNNDHKMLFLVETDDGRIVGQDGLSILENDTFMMDGTIRWGRGGNSRLFEWAGLERAAIGFGLLGCLRCEIHVFAKNVFAIHNIEAAGFSLESEQALLVSQHDGKTTYSTVAFGSENTEKRLLVYSMTKEAFSSFHQSLLDAPSWLNLV